MLTFFQIALEEQVIGRVNQIQPIIIMDNSVLEFAGLIFPLVTGIFFVLYLIVTRNEYSGLPPLRWTLLLFGGFLVLALLPVSEIPEDIFVIEEENTNTTSGTNPIFTTTPNTNPQPTTNQQNFTPEPGLLNFFTLFLSEIRNLFLLGIIILTIAFLLVLRRQSKLEQKETEEMEEKQELDHEKEYKIKTILECYYQASTSLEERGANDNMSFTPPEFTEDVRKKKLCPSSSITNLSNLFEEAKFSSHHMSETDVKNAKEITKEIIFASEFLLKEKTEDWENEEE